MAKPSAKWYAFGVMRQRVLCIDDEPDMCELAQAALDHRGFDVEWRTTPDEALQVLTEAEFDVVVTDLGMEGVGGLKLCEHLAERHPGVPPPMPPAGWARADSWSSRSPWTSSPPPCATRSRAPEYNLTSPRNLRP